MLDVSRLNAIFAKLPRLSIALVGDLFLDRYLDISTGPCELSIETGLEAYQVERVRNAPGALGTVMNNLAALDVGTLRPVTVVGEDGHGYDLLKALRRLPIDDDFILQDSERMTPTYTKPLKRDDLGAAVELNRFDVRSRASLSSSTSERLCKLLRSAFHSSDGLIVLDQIEEPNCGVVNRQIKDVLSELAREAPKKLIFIDSRAHLADFSDGILKGNRAELLAAAGRTSDDGATSVQDAAQQLAKRTKDFVFVTLGAEGIMVAKPSGEVELLPARPVSGPIDIVGAGDSATSGIVASLLAGADESEAAEIGNLVASITIGQLGKTGIATREQVAEKLAG